MSCLADSVFVVISGFEEAYSFPSVYNLVVAFVSFHAGHFLASYFLEDVLHLHY